MSLGVRKRQYQKEMEGILEEIRNSGRVPTLLLHSCCAPCSSYVLEYLSEYFEIRNFFYNPNISPEAEYRFRAEELQRLIREMPLRHSVSFVEGPYDPERFFEAAKGLEKEPEGGERCRSCFRLRLTEAAEKARELGCDFMTTTLTISPLKNASLLNEIGEEVTAGTGVRFLPSDFKKRDGYRRSTELSKKYELYRQSYCGCIFSKMEREERQK
ncbi:MAG: epoxyqueuosine reductase QueH [Eubacterium sp.]|nr:epoxyqueuosine reductase QueH [Eubacterium sp.]